MLFRSQKIENDKAIKVNVLTGANRLFLYDYLASIQISDKDILDVSVYNTDQGYVNGFLDTVKNKLSAESSTAALYIGGWTYINKEMAEAVQASNKEIKLIFLQEGTYYLVTIPAGADVTSCLDENGYAGPLYIASKVGVTKQLEK